MDSYQSYLTQKVNPYLDFDLEGLSRLLRRLNRDELSVLFDLEQVNKNRKDYIEAIGSRLANKS